MLLLGGLFDHHLNGDIRGALTIVGVGLVGIVAQRVIGGRLRGRASSAAQSHGLAIVRPLLVGLPVAWVYVTRWSGLQDTGTARRAMAMPIVVATVLAAARPLLDRYLAPWWRVRDTIPRVLRFAVAVATPVLLAFVYVQGAPMDIPALFGAATDSEVAVGARPEQIVNATGLTVVLVFLMVHEPRRTATT